MFYCNRCAGVLEWPKTGFKSFGGCEMCGNVDDCNDRPSSSLSIPTEEQLARITWRRDAVPEDFDYAGLEKDLEELEAEDPKVREAAEKYERAKQKLLDAVIENRSSVKQADHGHYSHWRTTPHVFTPIKLRWGGESSCHYCGGESGDGMHVSVGELHNEVARMREEIEELKVRDIVARNPGIDPDEVRRSRRERSA